MYFCVYLGLEIKKRVRLILILTLCLEDVGLHAIHDLRLQYLLRGLPSARDHILDDHSTPENNVQVGIGQKIEQTL